MTSSDLLNVRDLPVSRGFWNDDEMMEATGATSLMVTKAMQAKELVKAERHKNEADRLARSWRFHDLLKIAALVDFAEMTGFSIAASVAVFGGLRVEELDASLALTETSEAVRTHFSSWTELSLKSRDGAIPFPRPIQITRVDSTRIIIVDREFVYLKRQRAGERKFSQFELGRLVQHGRGANPRMRIGIFKDKPFSDDAEFLGAKSVLECRVANLGLRPFNIGSWEFAKVLITKPQ